MTSPVDASIITTSMPLLAMVLAAIYLKEPITGKKVLGIAVGATGALLLILGSHIRFRRLKRLEIIISGEIYWCCWHN